MSALRNSGSRRLTLTLAEPPDLPLTCATSWVATWFTGSLVEVSLETRSLETTSLVTTSTGTTAATFRLQSVVCFVCFVCFVLVLALFTTFPVFTVLKSIGTVPELLPPLRFGKVTFSHQALSEIFNGNFVLPWKRPLCSAFPKTVFQPVSNRA